MNKSNSGIELNSGNILRIYSKDETCEIERQWLKIFCKHKQGANTNTYKWHIFSFEKYPSVSGTKALDIYSEQKAAEYIVMSNDDEFAIETDTLPQECNLMDFYVFPKNMAWTMAFTHEDGWLGPYFATHKNYDKLNRINIEILKNNERKKKEIEIAKQNGWL